MVHKSCQEKQVYPDKITASISAAQINYDQDNRKRVNGRRVKIKKNGTPYRTMEYAPYKCAECRYWHLTTQERTVSKFKSEGGYSENDYR
jgi:hypothetical protein